MRKYHASLQQKTMVMKNLITLLMCGLAINCFADEPQPPAPSEPDGIIGGHEYVDLGLPSGTL